MTVSEIVLDLYSLLRDIEKYLNIASDTVEDRVSDRKLDMRWCMNRNRKMLARLDDLPQKEIR